MTLLLAYVLMVLLNWMDAADVPAPYVALAALAARPFGVALEFKDDLNPRVLALHDAEMDWRWCWKTARRGPPQHGEAIPAPKH